MVTFIGVAIFHLFCHFLGLSLLPVLLEVVVASVLVLLHFYYDLGGATAVEKVVDCHQHLGKIQHFFIR